VSYRHRHHGGYKKHYPGTTRRKVVRVLKKVYRAAKFGSGAAQGAVRVGSFFIREGIRAFRRGH